VSHNEASDLVCICGRELREHWRCERDPFPSFVCERMTDPNAWIAISAAKDGPVEAIVYATREMAEKAAKL
jgi:hypothetical protein